jgi:hypothetical protein
MRLIALHRESLRDITVCPQNRLQANGALERLQRTFALRDLERSPRGLESTCRMLAMMPQPEISISSRR